MKNPTLSRKYGICGKPLRCDCYYADYGLEQVVSKVKEMLKAKEG